MATLLSVLLVSATLSCGDDDNGVKPGEVLCGGSADFSARIKGRAKDLDICLDDRDVTTTYTEPPARFNVTARFVNGEGVFEIQMIFDHTENFPVDLIPTTQLTELETAPNRFVWINYIEVPDGDGATLESRNILSGTFTLGFSDINVIAATFADVSMAMQDVSNGEAAGTRLLDQGALSLSTR